MNRNRWLAVTGVAVILSFVLTFVVYRIVQKRLQPVEQTMPVVVADQKLPIGTRLTEASIRTVKWPKAVPIEGSFSDPKQIVGRGVITTIFPNEPIIDAKLAPKEGGAGLPSVIPDGMRAVSVKVNDVIGVAGFVLPGTRVDIIVTGIPRPNEDVASRVVLENVQVLAAGQNVEQDANGKPQNVQVVTLLVSPEQAQELALAGVDATIQLALRNPLDTQHKNPAAILRASLFYGPNLKPDAEKKASRPARPKRVSPKVEAAPIAPADRTLAIEVFLGRDKETLTFTEKIR